MTLYTAVQCYVNNHQIGMDNISELHKTKEKFPEFQKTKVHMDLILYESLINGPSRDYLEEIIIDVKKIMANKKWNLLNQIKYELNLMNSYLVNVSCM